MSDVFKNKESDVKKVQDITIEKFKIHPSNILDRGIIFYGPTGSGKTTVLKHFMYVCRDKFPMVHAFAPTNEEKHELDQIFPPMCVHDKLSLQKIKEIYHRQKAASNIYTEVNNVENLAQLYAKIRTPTDEARLRLLEEKKAATVIKMSKKFAAQQLKAEREKLDRFHNARKVAIYKEIISKNISKFKFITLTPEQTRILDNINIIPETLIIFEDATSELQALIKEGNKKNDEIIKSFFFKGRWAKITHFYIFHDDKAVDTDIRKNAHISVFTHKQVALTFFTRLSNGFTTDQRKKAQEIIQAVFNEDGHSRFPPFSKLVYVREQDKFYYTVANVYDDFKMGAPKLHELSEKIKKKNTMNSSNKYYNKFSAGARKTAQLSASRSKVR